MKKRGTAKTEYMAAMVIFGTIGVFVQKIPLPSQELALCRALLAIGLIGIYLLVTGSNLKPAGSKKELLLLFVSGTAVGMNWILLFEAYQYTTVSVATLSYYFAPVLITAACPFLFKEKLTAGQIFCFGMSTLGVVLIIGVSGMTGQKQELIGILFGLGAAVLYATAVLLNKFIQHVTGIHRTFLQFMAAAAVLLPYVLCTGGFHVTSLDAAGWGSLLIVGLLHTGIAYCMYFSSLNRMQGQEAAVLSYIDPLVAVAASVLILGEPITIWQAAGGILILGFAYLNEKK